MITTSGMLQIVLLAFVFHSSSCETTPKEAITIEELEELKGLVRASEITYQGHEQIWVRGCEWEQDYEPSEVEVNLCNDLRKSKSTTCNVFPWSICPKDNCLLGFEIDDNGCVRNCICKTQGLFQGDIMVKEQRLHKLAAIFGFKQRDQDSAAWKNIQKWNLRSRNGYFIVPYTIEKNTRRSREAYLAIKRAFYQFERYTCIKFKPKRNDRHYIKFVSDINGCWSHVGMVGGEQLVSIGKGCESKGIVMHELMHTLGFLHEQSRPDRDDFVEVNAENIREGYKREFRKMTSYDTDLLASPYDTASLMHYDGKDYSKDPKNLLTIIDKKTQRAVAAQRNGFSKEDIFKLTQMYKCQVISR